MLTWVDVIDVLAIEVAHPATCCIRNFNIDRHHHRIRLACKSIGSGKALYSIPKVLKNIILKFYSLLQTITVGPWSSAVHFTSCITATNLSFNIKWTTQVVKQDHIIELTQLTRPSVSKLLKFSLFNLF